MRNDTEPREEDVELLARSLARWYVRLDGKYYDVLDPGTKLSLPDVQRASVHRFRETHPEILLSKPLLKAVFDLAIQQNHDDRDLSISVWNGRRRCEPGTGGALIPERGMVTLNTWREPRYREIRGVEPSGSAFDGFLDSFFTRPQDRETFTNWLAWCLRNEKDKPAWAPFFYSKTKGSGKSTLCQIAARLFGEENSVTQNNVDKLTSKFNMTILNSKLVISEELQLRPDSPQSNALKTYITEENGVSELKGRESERVRQYCCFLFTSNHMPLWIEPEDRRYWIVEIDHDGHAAGPRAAEFGRTVQKVRESLADDRVVAAFYRKLMARELPADFNAKTLNVIEDATPVMRQIMGASRQTTLDLLQEELDKLGLNALPEARVAEFVTREMRGNVNSIKHLMVELGWSKQKAKWGGVDYSRAIWVRRGCLVDGGRVIDSDGESVGLTEHLKKLAAEGRLL